MVRSRRQRRRCGREPARPDCQHFSTSRDWFILNFGKMSAWSPTLEGFRLMFRRPSLSLAEIVWRFSFGAAACILFALFALAYLDTLPVTGSDLVKLRTGHPVLVSQAIAHIFHGTALRVVLAGVILLAALATLWILTASLGRVATLGPLLSHIR